MKPKFEKIITKPSSSILFKKVEVVNRPYVNGSWHFHPELEICLTLKGEGKRYVGNSITDYFQGDLVLLGENTPHCWITNECSQQIVIQFKKDFLGDHFFECPEFKVIQKQMKKAVIGIQLIGKSVNKAKKIILEMEKYEGAMKIIMLLQLLDLFSKTEEKKFIQNSTLKMSNNVAALERVQIVYDYILKNFSDTQLNLDDVAQLLNLTKSSFCKFIKKSTNKTFSQILNEIRINEGCKLLIQNQKSVSEISYSVGYNEASYFNRKFREIMIVSPLEYKNRFHKRALK